MSDPWKHRSQNMACKTCMWFAPKKAGENAVINLGRCRRHAPTMNGYPVVFVNDWCGDHKLDENKVLPAVSEPQFDSTLGRVNERGFPDDVHAEKESKYRERSVGKKPEENW